MDETEELVAGDASEELSELCRRPPALERNDHTLHFRRRPEVARRNASDATRCAVELREDGEHADSAALLLSFRVRAQAIHDLALEEEDRALRRRERTVCDAIEEEAEEVARDAVGEIRGDLKRGKIGRVSREPFPARETARSLLTLQSLRAARPRSDQ